MDNTCFLCNVFIKNEKINLKTKTTKYTNLNLFEFLQNLAPNASLIEHSDQNICHLCFTTINDLDLARKQCLNLTKLLLSYLDKRCIRKIETESTENFDVLCDSIKIKEEIDIGENEICYVGNVSVTTDLISSDNEEVFIKNESKDNVQVSNECYLYQNKFNSHNALALHINKQHDVDQLDKKLSLENNIENPICREYGNIIGKKLVKKDNDNSQKSYKCEECNKTFKTQFKLKSHTQTHSDLRPYIYNDKKLVRKTENNQVFCQKPYKCEKCNKTFKTVFELKCHVQTHSDLRPYVCEKCGQAYKRKSALKIHIGMHNGINPFTCNYCNKSFTQKISLDRHLPIHTGDCPFQCDFCGKRFIHHTSFRIHQATHTRKKYYKCVICGIGVVSSSHLTRHMRMHTGEKKYECPTCTKKFADKCNLMRHMKLHVQEMNPKKYKCEICCASFQRPNNLMKHMFAKHQGVHFSKSDECDK